MNCRILLFFLCLFSLNAMGQVPIKRETCTTCGKLLSQCQYKGKHPTCKDCGKLVEKCQYKGNHPRCKDCGKLIEKCEYKGKHPTCEDCGKLIEKCQYRGNHPKCKDCGKLLEACLFKGNHPRCPDCGKLTEDCPYKGNHPRCADCGKLLEACLFKGNHPKCADCGKLTEDCPYKGNHPEPEGYAVSFSCNVSSAQLYVDGEVFGSPTGTKYLPAGSHTIKVIAEGYVPQEMTFSANSNNRSVSILLEKETSPVPPTPKKPHSYFNKSEFHILPEFWAGSLMGVGGTIGVYLANINVDGYFHYGLTESPEIWWNGTSNRYAPPYSATYRPMLYGARLGYGIRLGGRMRLTPQVGIGHLFLLGNSSQKAFRGYSIMSSAGIKTEFALLKHFALGIAPEYRLCLSKSKTYEMLSSVSSAFDKWAAGFNCRLFLSVYF